MRNMPVIWLMPSGVEGDRWLSELADSVLAQFDPFTTRVVLKPCHIEVHCRCVPPCRRKRVGHEWRCRDRTCFMYTICEVLVAIALLASALACNHGVGVSTREVLADQVG